MQTRNLSVMRLALLMAGACASRLVSTGVPVLAQNLVEVHRLPARTLAKHGIGCDGGVCKLYASSTPNPNPNPNRTFTPTMTQP